MKWLALVLTIGLWSPAALCQSIGVFADPLGTDCNLIIPYPGGAATVYVVGIIDGAAASGVTGAAFRIGGLPEGWTASVTSLGEDVTLANGNPFAEGIVVAHSRCVAGTRMLFAVSITPNSSVENAPLLVFLHTDANYHNCGIEGEACIQPCPRFCGCGDFGIPCYCAESVRTTINGQPCLVETQGWSWGKIKSTYR